MYHVRCATFLGPARPRRDCTKAYRRSQWGMCGLQAGRPLLTQHKQGQRCRFVLGGECQDVAQTATLLFEVASISG